MFWLLIIPAYLLGSVSFAIVLSKLSGKIDPRTSGSKNPGATNVLRIAGAGLASLTLIGDLCKGMLPVIIAILLDFNVQQQAWIGIAAIIGHLYPIYFHFHGGKGVATATGVLLILSPITACLAIFAWGITFYLKRTSSLASISAIAIILPIILWLKPIIFLPICVLCLLIIWRHKSNLKDLLIGNERHF